MNKNQPIVSVCIITYNHESYIKDAIEGILSQQLSFPFECVIGEDHSTDNTRLICEQYVKEYPHILKLLPSERNRGIIPNFIRTLKSCKGKYIAICEGDDYWTDNLKLKKQVDFMESNPDFTLCGHSALQLFEEGERPNQLYKPKILKEYYTIKDLIFASSIPTASFMIRNGVIKDLPSWLYDIRQGDYAILLLSAACGKVKFIDEAMSVYRKHSNSESGFVKGQFGLYIDYSIRLLRYFNNYTDFKYNKLIKKRIRVKKKQKLVHWVKKMMKEMYLYIFPRNT